MQISIFTTGTETVADENDDIETMSEFFQGLFTPIANYAEQLESYGDVDLYILSDVYGLVMGDDIFADTSYKEGGITVNDAQEAILEAGRTSDIVIVALSNFFYDQIVEPVWPEIVESATEEQIWCISASKSVLKQLDIEKLEQKGCEVIIYEKMGVARLSTDTRDTIVELIEN